MKIIGLTGRSGSGKSTLAAALGRLGATVLDGDSIAAGLMQPTSPILNKVLETFGNSYALPDGSLDRKRLGELVFSEGKSLSLLNSIVHPAFKQNISGLIEDLQKQAAAPDYVIIDAAVLFDAGIDKMCDMVVAVLCDEKMMAKRISVRDGIDEEKAAARIAAQKKRLGDYEMSLKADITVISRGDPAEMDEWAERLIRIVKEVSYAR